MNEEYWEEVILKLAEEAMKRDKDKGMIIENPSGFLRYKVERIRHQAKEDKDWLIRQRDRIMGTTQPPLHMLICERCGAMISPTIRLEHEGKNYCDIICLEGEGQRMTLHEWMRRLKKTGSVTGWREDSQGNRVEFTVTYEQAARTNPKIALALSHEDALTEDDDEF